MTLIFPCDLCGATDRLPLPGDPSGKIGICKGCGFCYVSERRSIEEVAKAWSDIYANGGYDPNWPGVKARLFYTAEWLDQIVGLKGKDILDIGAGNGEFLLRCLHRMAGELYGIDPDAANCQKLQDHGFKFWQGYAERGAEPVGQFDIVTLNWTLENTADCMSVLEYAKSCLKPDGMIVVATGSRIGVPYKKPLQDYIPQYPDYPHDTHCFRWSFVSIAQALHKIGFIAAANNDYRQRDEMIVVSGPDTYGYPSLGDDSHEVFNYFADWQRTFP